MRHTVLGLTRPGSFPIFIRASDLDQHIEKAAGEPGSPAQKHSPRWIAHFLAAGPWGLKSALLEARLRKPGVAVFLDGLDEAGDDVRRRSLTRMLEEAVRAYPECRFVVTTRPASFDGLPGFTETRIENLDDAAVDRFLELWSSALHAGDAVKAASHHAELRRALDEKPEIRRMARNPVMLTALAVVHWNERRMPEQRAELYESVLVWLARSRESRLGRLKAEACLDRLGDIALAMQTESKGRLTQVERGKAADWLVGMEKKAALKFLEEEELDSGIIVSRGANLRFWHLTFQEFLAARELAGMKDTEQFDQVLKASRLYRPEWREVMVLLAGILKVKQGSGKVHGLFEAITSAVGEKFVDQAHCVALLNAMLLDLRPTGYEPECKTYFEMLERMKPLFDPSGGEGARPKDSCRRS